MKPWLRVALLSQLALGLTSAVVDAQSPEHVHEWLVPGTAVDTLELTWNADSGWVYFIQASPTLEEDSWGYLPEAIVGTDVQEALVIRPQDPGAPAQMFYRVVRTPDLGGYGLDQDADGDGLSNADEFAAGTDPLEPDSDNDGLSDGIEVDLEGTDPNDPDSDDDGLSDWEELTKTATDPLSPDSDGDGIPDPQEDPDDDGLSNSDELDKGTDPLDEDSDDDGLDDGFEDIVTGTDPLEPDTDGDGLTDGEEFDLGLDPNDPFDVGPLVDNDPNAPTNPTDPDIIKHFVKGNNDPNAGQGPVTETIYPMLERDTSYIALVAVESEEFPYYTRTSSQWNDTFEWSVKVGDDVLSNDSSHVNALHSQWLEAITRGSSLFGLRPLHYLWVGSIKPKTSQRLTTLFGKVGNVADENLPTTLVIAFIPVRINPIAQVPAIGDMVPSNKLLEPEYLFHYVSPMQSQWLSEPFAGFEVVSPDRDIFDQLLRWAPDSAGEPDSGVPPNPLLRNASRATPGKFPLKFESNPDATGLPAEDVTELDAWIVWANGVIRNSGNPSLYTEWPGGKTIDGRDTELSFWRPIENVANTLWQFVFEIHPFQIVEDYATEDLPALSGGALATPVTPGIGSSHPVKGPGTDLGNGADRRWDVSRRMEVRILNQQMIPKNDFKENNHDLYSTQPSADSTPIPFPSDALIGNDDDGFSDEDNNPYAQHSNPSNPALNHNIGYITSVDGPTVWMTDIAAAQGRTYQETDSFGEFARLQLTSGWFRISEDLEWSTTLKIKYDPASTPQNPKWQDDGSTSTP